MIRCRCLVPHLDHQFTPGAFGLCQHCSHGVGVHKADEQANADLVERLNRLLRLMDLDACLITPKADGSIVIDLTLVPTPVRRTP